MNLKQKVRDLKHQQHHVNLTKLDLIRIIN